jgi:anti-sigma factor RsiW
MGDRMDIDALLIGALYGELTPADEARLAAHLESHPADRTVLADLSRTREAVRSSRVLAAQVEPPQSVTALLIQEAARRLPKREPGWFYRITRMLLAHPAMAVAAMFVIILGVAGTLHVRRGDQFAESTRTAPAEAASEHAAATSAPPDMVTTAPQVPAAEPMTAVLKNQGSAAPEPGALKASRAGLETDRADRADRDDAKLEKRSKERTPEPGPVPAPSKKTGIVLRSREPMPKDLEERNEGAKGDVDHRREGGAKPTAPGAGAGAADDGQSAAKGKPRAQQVPGSTTLAQEAAAPAAAAPPPAPPPPADAPSQRQGRMLADKPVPVIGKAEDKAGEDKTLLGWARKQHDQVIALVRSSKCDEAANLATEIYTRAPDYYAANVETDRSVKPCVSYLSRERQREDRSRAASKRALSNEAPASPSPTKSKK